jgi:hypothetical protein
LFDEAVESAAVTFGQRRCTPPNSPFVVTADLVGEAVAFVAIALDPIERDRSMVVDEVHALPAVLTAGINGLIVIANPLAEAPAVIAVDQHHIVARAHSAVPIEPNVELRPLSWRAFEEALLDMGVAQEDRDRMATEAGRSPTILRRRLAIAPELCTRLGTRSCPPTQTRTFSSLGPGVQVTRLMKHALSISRVAPLRKSSGTWLNLHRCPMRLFGQQPISGVLYHARMLFLPFTRP